MSSKLTQIALDFGQEPQPQPAPPPAGDGAGEGQTRPYLAAGGVGFRVKSFKQPTTPAAAASPEVSQEMASRPAAKVINGDLFGMGEQPIAAGAEEAAITGHAASSERAEAAFGTVPHAPVEDAPQPVVETEALAPMEAGLSPLEIETVEPPVEAAALPSVETQPSPPAETLAPVEVETLDAIETGTPASGEPEFPPSPRRRTPPGKSAQPKLPSKRGRKSLKQVAAEADLIEIPTDEVLFSKQYYTMGEVSEMFRVNQSLLRFWETEFDILQPKKNKKGDRYFRPVDIKNLHLIYHLLRQRKYTIEGAKDFLKKNKKAEDRFEVIQRLQQIKAFLVEWRAQL